MRFFYNYFGKIGEFRLWQGDALRAALNYRGRVGPFTKYESSRLLAYYRFVLKEPYGRDYFLYDDFTGSKYPAFPSYNKIKLNSNFDNTVG